MENNMSDKMEISEWYGNFKSFMEKDTRGSQLGIYSAAGLGLAFAVYKIRPFTILTSPRNIPKKFLTERIEQKGLVSQIEPAENVLLVKHYPPLRVPFLHWGNPGLPVKIFGIELSGNAISWLQTIVSGQKVKFVPVTTNKNHVNCIVTMEHKPFNAKSGSETLNVGEYLVRIGFARVSPIEESLNKDTFINSYKNKLKSAQLQAQRKSMGLWNTVSADIKLITKLKWFLFDKLRQIFQMLSIRKKKLAVTKK